MLGMPIDDSNDSSQEPTYETSDNGNSQVDVFALEFAASQWMKLVSNAENLFNDLVVKGIPTEAKEQIEQWLYLKQECDECIANDSSIAVQSKVSRSLERIDEVTESEDKSSSDISEDEALDCESIDEDTEKEDSVGDKLLDSNNAQKRQNFNEKLGMLMTRLRHSTDEMVCQQLVRYMVSHQLVPYAKVSSPKGNNGRRKTILPGQITFPLPERTFRHIEQEKIGQDLGDCNPLAKDTSPLADRQSDQSTSKDREVHNQVDLVILELEDAHKRVDDLQQIIKIKEQYIKDMIEVSGANTTAKAKYQRKLNKLEEEYFKTKQQQAKAEKLALSAESGKKGAEKYKALASHFEKRLEDLETMKTLVLDCSKKVVELEGSLHGSKKKLQNLVAQLKKEEEDKARLEEELERDKKRLHDLEEKYRLQSSKINQYLDGSKQKWLEDEEKRIAVLQESSQKLQDKLLDQKRKLDRREAFLKEVISRGRNAGRAKGKHASERVNEETEEVLRHEIRNLRKTRDLLVDQRRKLDIKINKEKVYTAGDERRFLECDEAIEAIDAIIEYKNELMLGYSSTDSCGKELEKGDQMLLDRLMNLSETEMRALLYKYFRKIIDLRESGRRFEQQLEEQDQQIEAQAWKIQALGNALQQANIENERRLVTVHREHQEKLSLMYRHYAGDTSEGSSMDMEGNKLYFQNRALKHRILELEGLLHSQDSLEPKAPSPAIAIPQQNLIKLQGSSSAPTTKVTRHKNKLIIQQSKSKLHK